MVVAFCIGYPLVSNMMPAMSFLEVQSTRRHFYWYHRNLKEWNRSSTPSLLFLCHSASATQSSPISCLQCRFELMEHSETYYWCRRKYKRMESKFDTVVAVFVSFCIGYPVVSTRMPTMSSSLDVQSTPRRFLDVLGNLKECNRSSTASLLCLRHSAFTIQTSPIRCLRCCCC